MVCDEFSFQKIVLVHREFAYCGQTKLSAAPCIKATVRKGGDANRVIHGFQRRFFSGGFSAAVCSGSGQGRFFSGGVQGRFFSGRSGSFAPSRFNGSGNAHLPYSAQKKEKYEPNKQANRLMPEIYYAKWVYAF